MALPEYPETILWLLLLWVLGALFLVLRTEAAFDSQYQPFWLCIERRFHKKPSCFLIGIYALLGGALLLSFVYATGSLALYGICFWLIIFGVIRVEFEEKPGNVLPPFLDTPEFRSLHIGRLEAFFYSFLYFAGVVALAFIMLAFSAAAYRIIPLYQERCYLKEASFFLRGSPLSIFNPNAWKWDQAAGIIFASVPFAGAICILPTLAALCLFNSLVQRIPRFGQYQVLRFYCGLTFDCFKGKDQTLIWEELLAWVDFRKLQQMQRQRAWFLALFVWVFGGLGFLLTFDFYARATPNGLYLNPLYSFREVFYPWSEATSLEFVAGKISPSDKGFNSTVWLSLRNGKRIKIWSYHILAGKKVLHKVGRESGFATTADLLRLIDSLSSQGIVLSSNILQPQHLEVLEHCADDEAKRSVLSVYKKFNSSNGSSGQIARNSG